QHVLAVRKMCILSAWAILLKWLRLVRLRNCVGNTLATIVFPIDRLDGHKRVGALSRRQWNVVVDTNAGVEQKCPRVYFSQQARSRSISRREPNERGSGAQRWLWCKRQHWGCFEL